MKKISICLVLFFSLTITYSQIIGDATRYTAWSESVTICGNVTSEKPQLSSTLQSLRNYEHIDHIKN